MAGEGGRGGKEGVLTLLGEEVGRGRVDGGGGDRGVDGSGVPTTGSGRRGGGHEGEAVAVRGVGGRGGKGAGSGGRHSRGRGGRRRGSSSTRARARMVCVTLTFRERPGLSAKGHLTAGEQHH